MPHQNTDSISRRSFGTRAALAAAITAADPSAALPQGRGQSALASADQAEVDAKFASVVRKYGDRLSDEQKTRVRTVLVRHQRMLARIRTFPVENGDAPATGLRLYPKDTKE